jgi:hypothetical protein
MDNQTSNKSPNALGPGKDQVAETRRVREAMREAADRAIDKQTGRNRRTE